MLNRYTGDRDLIPHSSTWPRESTTALPTPLQHRMDNWVLVLPPEGSAIRCSHCNSVAACVSGDNLIVVQRHHGNWHKNVISLEALGYVQISKTIGT